MANTAHDSLTGTNIHTPITWTYADEAAREAASGFAVGDVYKIALQEDDNSVWMLVDDDPATWAMVGSSATGDMLKATYDTNDDGIVDEADVATDGDAIHDNVTGEINAVTEKETPVIADKLLLEDSAASHAKKMVQIQNLFKTITGLTEQASPADEDLVVIQEAAGGAVKKVQLVNLPGGGGGGIPDDGWVASGETWTYASADDPIYTLTIPTDLTGKYSVGMRVKLTQTTVKYFIIHGVAYGAPNTTLTIYGGTDYDLADAAITDNYYSVVKAPQGFSLNPTKWSVLVTDTSERVQGSATEGTWYNINSISISIPIGGWNVRYQVSPMAYNAATKTLTGFCSTLSTANNSESDINLTSAAYIFGITNNTANRLLITFFREKVLIITSKTSYYLNHKIIVGGTTDLYLANNVATLIIEAICAYL